ncbi:MAG TPA: Gfo/Idh/MocA family oxidoreductase [Candidatus Limiplasma sp.]|nr:Gfo/Idh/MocA family oxidoreductase [Candidatus Limiplasma sp.]
MIHVAIIGTGGIAPAHIEGYLAFPKRCKIVALVDIYPQKAEAMKVKFNLDADVYDDHEKLFSRGDIDLVSVCTPPYTHAAISINCMNHGMDVICEKPMAASLWECDRMIETRDTAGRRLSVISQNRFRNPVWKLKQMLDSGVAGKALHAQFDSYWWRGHCYYDLWWRGTWAKEGGGCTLNHAVHHIDMLNWMMGGLPAELTAVLANLNHDNSEVEDFSVVIGRYESGAVSTLTSSLVHHGEEQRLVFQCERAKLSAPWHPQAYKSLPNGFCTPDEDTLHAIDAQYQALPDLPYEGHPAQIDNVLRAIERGDRDFLVQGEDGRRTLEFITAVYKSGFTEQKVTLPLARDDPFYTVEGIRQNVRHFYEKTASVENFAPAEISMGSKYDKYDYKA